MKKLFLTLALTSLCLVACNNNDKLSIVSPTGAPALAFYNSVDVYDFETNSDPNNIVAMMAAGQKDIVVLPTNAGMQAIKNKNAPYLIGATITFGNFYIAATGNDDNNVMDAGDTILLFQKNNVPDKLFHYIYGNEFDNGVHYVTAVTDAAKALTIGTFTTEEGTIMFPDYVMIAEPALSNVLSKKDNVSVYANIQEKYKEKSGGKEIFQASIFVKNSVNKNVAESFLSKINKDIDNAITDPGQFNELMKSYDKPEQLFGVAPEMATSVLRNGNGMGLGFKYARDNKEAIENFLSLFNIKDIDEKVYF